MEVEGLRDFVGTCFENGEVLFLAAKADGAMDAEDFLNPQGGQSRMTSHRAGKSHNWMPVLSQSPVVLFSVELGDGLLGVVSCL